MGVEFLLTVIAALLSILTALVAVGGRRLLSTVDNHGRRLTWLELHHFRNHGEEMTP